MQTRLENLKKLSHEELHLQTKSLVERERRITTEVLHHLREIDRRMAYADRGYPSLFAYAVSELKYDEASAYRRIAAMRLLVEIPSIESKINSGELNVSVLTQAATFFRKRKKQGKPVSTAERRDIIEKLESKSKREALELFADLAPVMTLAAETVTPLNPKYVEMKIPIPRELQAKIDRIRELWAHQHDGSYEEVLGLMAEFVLKKIEPERKVPQSRAMIGVKTRESSLQTLKPIDHVRGGKTLKPASGVNEGVPSKNELHNGPIVPEASIDESSLSPEKVKNSGDILSEANSLSGAPMLSPKKPPSQSDLSVASFEKEFLLQNDSRYIASKVKRTVYLRDGGLCTFTDAKTGRQCGSRYRLQYEHRHPFALGGQNTVENLTLHCATHNRLNAEKVYGRIFFDERADFTRKHHF